MKLWSIVLGKLLFSKTNEQTRPYSIFLNVGQRWYEKQTPSHTHTCIERILNEIYGMEINHASITNMKFGLCMVNNRRFYLCFRVRHFRPHSLPLRSLLLLYIKLRANAAVTNNIDTKFCVIPSYPKNVSIDAFQTLIVRTMLIRSLYRWCCRHWTQTQTHSHQNNEPC